MTNREYVIKRLNGGHTIHRTTDKHLYAYKKVNGGVHVRSMSYDSGIIKDKIISEYSAIHSLIRNFKQIG